MVWVLTRTSLSKTKLRSGLSKPVLSEDEGPFDKLRVNGPGVWRHHFRIDQKVHRSGEISPTYGTISWAAIAML